MPDLPTLENLLAKSISGQRVLIRADLNLPLDPDGRVTDTTRLNSLLPSLIALKTAGARIGILSHLGRPKARPDKALSLAPIAKPLGDALGEALQASTGKTDSIPIQFVPNCIGADAKAAMEALKPGEICLLENTRFHAGEMDNAPDFVQALADLGEHFVLDALSIAHRQHASCYGLAQWLPSYAGFALHKDLQQLTKFLGTPKAPFVAVMGGAKISDKIESMRSLARRCQAIILGGAMANTFLLSQDFPIGKSFAQPDCIQEAQAILALSKLHDCELVLPTHLVAAPSLQGAKKAQVFGRNAIPRKYMIFDCAQQSFTQFAKHIDTAATLIWNGPIGMYEAPPFDAGSMKLARYIAQRSHKHGLVSVIGGGDSIAIAQRADVAEQFTYMCTAGGAFLDWLVDGTLPCLDALARLSHDVKNSA